MWRSLTPIMLLALAAGCSASDDAANQGGRSVDNVSLTKPSLTSADFREGQPIPAKFTCDGGNVRPSLDWSDPPQGTRSFALVVDDPDAPGGTFAHWGLYDIPGTARSFDGPDVTGREAINGFGKPRYGGPCPPEGHGPHHYHFKLYALDVDTLTVPGNPKVEDVEHAAQAHALGRGELIGTYERK